MEYRSDSAPARRTEKLRETKSDEAGGIAGRNGILPDEKVIKRKCIAAGIIDSVYYIENEGQAISEAIERIELANFVRPARETVRKVLRGLWLKEYNRIQILEDELSERGKHYKKGRKIPERDRKVERAIGKVMRDWTWPAKR